jgi:hypothetical protein
VPIKVMSVRDLFAPGAGTQTIKALMAGPPGSGKTRSASTWPDPLYADIEGRLLSVRDRDVNRVKIDTVAEMEELKVLLDQTPEIRRRMLGADVKTLVIDTVDELARMIIKERLRAEKIETFRMADWGWFGDQLRGILRGYRNIEDLNVLFNCHVKATEDSETGRVEKKPDIQGSVGNEIAAYVDQALLLVARPVVDPGTGQREIKRYLQCYPDSQHDWIKDHSGMLPMEFPINFEDDYERLAQYVFGTAVTAPKAEVKLTTSTADDVVDKSRSNSGKAGGVVKRGVKAPSARPTVDVTIPDVIDPPQPDAEPELPPEPALPPEPEPQPEPEPAPVLEKETVSTDPEPESSAAQAVCSVCGVVIDNPDIVEVSEIRYGVRLCRQHFSERRSKK